MPSGKNDSGMADLELVEPTNADSPVNVLAGSAKETDGIVIISVITLSVSTLSRTIRWILLILRVLKFG